MQQLLILQGGPGLSKNYLKTDCIESNFDILRVEYLGCSPDYRGDTYGLNETLADVYKQVQDLSKGNKDFHILAHSWGNYVVLKLFELYGQITLGKIICLTPFPVSWEKKLQLGPKMQETLADRVAPNRLARAKELKSDRNGPEDKEYINIIAPAYVAKGFSFDSLYQNYHKEQLERIFSELEGYDLNNVLKGITNPIHLVLGEHDFVIAENASEYEKVAQDLTVLKGVGHSPFIEDAEQFKNLVSNILNLNGQP